jgi:hypothetical protein
VEYSGELHMESQVLNLANFVFKKIVTPKNLKYDVLSTEFQNMESFKSSNQRKLRWKVSLGLIKTILLRLG